LQPGPGKKKKRHPPPPRHEIPLKKEVPKCVPGPFPEGKKKKEKKGHREVSQGKEKKRQHAKIIPTALGRREKKKKKMDVRSIAFAVEEGGSCPMGEKKRGWKRRLDGLRK